MGNAKHATFNTLRQAQANVPIYFQVATDIRVAAPSQDILTTSFTMNEWESEEEDSNSSEEFIYTYVRGDATAGNGFTEISLKAQSSPVPPHKIDPKQDAADIEREKELLWSPHKDQIPVASPHGNFIRFLLHSLGVKKNHISA